MELQTGDNPSCDRSPVALIKTDVVSQFATIATTGEKAINAKYYCSFNGQIMNIYLL